MCQPFFGGTLTLLWDIMESIRYFQLLWGIFHTGLLVFEGFRIYYIPMILWTPVIWTGIFNGDIKDLLFPTIWCMYTHIYIYIWILLGHSPLNGGFNQHLQSRVLSVLAAAQLWWSIHEPFREQQQQRWRFFTRASVQCPSSVRNGTGRFVLWKMIGSLMESGTNGLVNHPEQTTVPFQFKWICYRICYQNIPVLK